MSKHFSVEDVRETMNNNTHIRNLSVIAHVDHGKTTLTDSLAAAAGLIRRANAGDALVTSTRPDEKIRGITIKSTGIAIYVEVPGAWCPTSSPTTTTTTTTASTTATTTATSNGNGECVAANQRYLFNLVDSPGHVDFSSEVTAALRVTDGALVVVDCIEGMCVQTQTVLRQALAERVKPVLVLNKLDRCFNEKQMELEDIYQSLCRTVESVNVVIATHRDPAVGEVAVDPLAGTVVFASAKQAWGFSLITFAEMYCKKGNQNAISASAVASFSAKLWGENFYDVQNKCWSTSPTSSDGRNLPRGFCHFILAPVQRMLQACSRATNVTDTSARKDLEELMGKLGIKKDTLSGATTGDEQVSNTHSLMRQVMQSWIPCDAALIRMIIKHLPSPQDAQRYRVDTLYTGPKDDATATAIRACDPNGPLCIFISKMVPDTSSGGTRFYAFGRVFSGTVSTGQKVNIMGPQFSREPAEDEEPHKKQDSEVDYYSDKSVFRVVVPMGKQFQSVPSVPAGNTVALVGVDQYILKCCTISSDSTAWPIANMNFSVAPVVRVAVEPKVPSMLPAFVQALQRLSKTDQVVQCSVAPTGEHIVAAAGELHLEIVLHDLYELMKGDPNLTMGSILQVSEPVVTLMETVSEKSSIVCMAKSPNRFNRVYTRASPLSASMTSDIEKIQTQRNQEDLSPSRSLLEQNGFEPSEIKCCWGALGNNLLFDCTKAVQYLREAKDSINAGYQWVARDGPLCGERLRGVRFDLCDLTLHSDTVHRSGAQLIPAAKRAFYAAFLTAAPRVSEPVYLMSVQSTRAKVGPVYSVINRRRGVVQEEVSAGNELVTITAFLPVLESFGITTELRAATSGQAFPQMTFSHWQVMLEDPLQPSTKAGQIVSAARVRKGLSPEVPPLDRFLDKL